VKKLTIEIDKKSIRYLILDEISKEKGISADDLVNEYIQAGINKDFDFNDIDKILEKE
jgi:hypothetical protein